MAEAYLGLGSNLGDRAAMLEAAVAGLAATPGLTVVGRSALYETPPWGEIDQPAFLNAALAVHTRLGPHELLDACLAVERALGRVRDRRWGPRTIDIDIVDYDALELDEPGLTLPHPRLTERAFVLIPLAEIAPDRVVAGRPVRDWAAAVDGSGVTRL